MGKPLFVLGKPTVTVDMPLVKCIVGKSLCAEATVRGNPNTDVTWKFNKKDLSKDRDYVLENDGIRHKMIIKKSSTKHSGVYTVAAFNAGGNAAEDVNIIIIGLFI